MVACFLPKYIVCVILICILYIGVIGQADASQPNFIFILMDDQDLLLGSPSYMPNLQSLIVKQGVTFDNAFVATPVCCPSRTETVTGRYFHNIGAPNGNCFHIDATDNVWSNTTIFNQLYQNGYKTGVFGKLTNKDGTYFCSSSAKNVTDAGMSRVYSMCNQQDYYAPKYLSHYDNGTQFFTNLNTSDESTYQSAQLGNQSLDFIVENLKNESPFLAYIGFHCPHEPYTPPPWFAGTLSKDIKAPRTPNFNLKVDGQMEWVNNQPKLENVSIEAIDQIYRDRIESTLQVDLLIEEIIKELEQYNAIDNTYIIYSSDHGYKLGQWRLPCEKSFIYDTDIRVPFYVRGPGIAKASTSSVIIGNVDIMPTVLDLAGIDIPSNVDGKSWASKVVNVSDDIALDINRLNDGWRDMFLVEYMAHANQYFNICGTWYPTPGDFHGKVVRPNPVDQATGDFIYVDWGQNKNPGNTWREIRILNSTHNWAYAEYVNYTFTEQDKESPYLYVLFDLSKDPYEIDNIYQETDNNIQSQLHQMLMDYGKCKANDCP